MTELAGVPEIGILSLYYYFAGGTLDSNVVLSQTHSARIRTSTRTGNMVQEHDYQHFFSSMEEGGLSSCFIPPCIPSSQVLKEILKSLSLLSTTEDGGGGTCTENTLPKAGEILGMLSKAKLKNQEGRMDMMFDHDIGTPLPSILKFWESSNFHPRNYRPLSPLLQLLLLKLLYVTPNGGPFLTISCRALPHLEHKFCVDKQLERNMRTNYKSHWAYYILIKAMILGERIKPSRRAQIQYHVPVWDIVFGLDSREEVKESETMSTTTATCSPNNIGNEDTTKTLNDIVLRLSQATDEHLPTRVFRPPNCFEAHLPLYVLGDSHALSIGWQTLCIADNNHSCRLRTLVPNPVTGLKAWHTRPQTQFFTYTNLQRNLERLPTSTKTIILTAGEIDCREGIGGEELSGYNKSCDDAVVSTVISYVDAIHQLSKNFGLQILLMPVAPHAHRSDRNGKSTGRAFRRERMKLWNDHLREECQREDLERCGLFLLDYEEHLRQRCESSSVGFVLKKSYNADYTHMNSAFLPLLQTSILSCGCDLNLL